MSSIPCGPRLVMFSAPKTIPSSNVVSGKQHIPHPSPQVLPFHPSFLQTFFASDLIWFVEAVRYCRTRGGSRGPASSDLSCVPTDPHVLTKNNPPPCNRVYLQWSQLTPLRTRLPGSLTDDARPWPPRAMSRQISLHVSFPKGGPGMPLRVAQPDLTSGALAGKQLHASLRPQLCGCVCFLLLQAVPLRVAGARPSNYKTRTVAGSSCLVNLGAGSCMQSLRALVLRQLLYLLASSERCPIKCLQLAHAKTQATSSP